MRRQIHIDGKNYSFTQATTRFRGILKTTKPVAPTDKDYAFVFWAFTQRRPDRVYRTVRFKVALGADEKYNCLWHNIDEEGWEAFSYKKALEPSSRVIDGFSGSYSKTDYLKAFRNCVYAQIKSFRESEIVKYPELVKLSAKDPFNVHTDHVIPMHILISDFLNDRGMKLKDVPLRKTIMFNTDHYIIADEGLSEDWQEYHRVNARFRLTTKEVNLSKAGSQDIPLYSYKKRRGETYD